jgi:hypothetical protein
MPLIYGPTTILRLSYYIRAFLSNKPKEVGGGKKKKREGGKIKQRGGKEKKRKKKE